ncbi:MAG: DUF541 domain-containing protein [Candidatus Abyssobacteria bacterium SURF_5]|uniref:DUF541 domain-containing protein n=1 Tax=Abyssobacteria bacterium (strain SURF_5) TaxID=2093360 RepID=A0A3A4NHA5_ABYX5|nr:MAG: DUF541 domain-containing protein [Candidatus Abyssubacteria bacterium SURF_5]
MRRLTTICLLLTALAISKPAFAIDECPQPRLITVTGNAEVRVTPDEVILTLGVETWNKDLTTAKNDNDRRVQKILQLVKSFGIEDKHVKTDFISIEPRYEDQWEHRNFIGYFVRKTVVITLRDTAKFETLLSRALEAGADYVLGIEFRTTELRKHRDQARALAIKAAQEKATDLAKALGQTIERPHSITEHEVGWWSSYNTFWGARWSGGMAQNVMQTAGGPSTPETTIAPGQIVVTARVTVSFELQ